LRATGDIETMKMFRDNRSRAGALLQDHREIGRGGGGGPWRDLMEGRGVGGKGPKGAGQEGRPFSPRQEPSRKTPPAPRARRGVSHKTLSRAAAPPFPRDTAGRSAKGRPRRLVRRHATGAEREADRRALPTKRTPHNCATTNPNHTQQNHSMRKTTNTRQCVAHHKLAE